MNGPSPRAVVFDLDDTLYDREQFVRSGFEAVAGEVERRHAVPAPWALATLRHARAHGHAGVELQALCANHGLPLDVVPALIEVIRSHRPALDLAPAAGEILARLRADGWRLGILTNGHPPTQRAKVGALGLDARVDAVLYAEEHAPGGKPSRAAFDAALAALGVTPGRAVFVGDDLVKDVAGAHAAGLATIRLAGPTRWRHAEDADTVLSRLEDVPAAAAALLKGTDSHAA